MAIARKKADWPTICRRQIELSGALEQARRTLLGRVLEDKTFFSNNPFLPISDYEAKKLNATGRLESVDAVINSSFFGGMYGPENQLYFGLNITLELELQGPNNEFSHEKPNADARYSKMDEIVELMQSYGVRSPGSMVGKMAKGYLANVHGRQYLVALSPRLAGREK